MSKIAFLFSGQGSQYVGMGQSFYESSETARRLMDEANTLLPFDLKEICFEDSKELINQTTYTQPAIFVVSQMALALLKEAGIKADVVAGFSLGEYSALCAAHVFNFTEGVSLVAKRGELMGTASNNGKMAALLGLDLQKAQAVCDEASSKGIVELANLNCPGQIVIGGEAQAVTYACEIAKNHGAKTIALTDNMQSPIVEYADCSLIAKSDVMTIVDSMVCPLSVVNALVTAVALLRKDDVEKRLMALEELWNEYDVYNRSMK